MAAKNEWHNSGWNCFSPCSTCLLSWCCPCIVYGRTRHRVKENGNMNGYSACNGSCLAFCGLSFLGVSWVLPMIRRGDMRAKHNLTGNGCTDCLCACCCGPCDLTQQDKEAAYREGKSGPVAQQPAPTDNMAYKPQHAQSPPQPAHFAQQPGQYAQQHGQYAQQPPQYAPQQQHYPQGQYTHQQY